MPAIVLLRHGQASFGAADYDELSSLGREQSTIAGRALAERGVREPMVVAGSLRRQRDTARLAAAAMGVDSDVRIDARFNEYDHIGMVRTAVDAADEVPTDDPVAFQRILDQALRRWIAADEPDGWRGFRDDAVTALRGLAEALPSGRDAVVATSGGVIAAICGALLGASADGVVMLNRVTINAGLTTVIVGRTGVNLLSFNDHAHLAHRPELRTHR